MRFKCLNCRRKGPAKDLRPTYLNGEVCPRCESRQVRRIAEDGLDAFERASLLYSKSASNVWRAIAMAEVEEGLALRRSRMELASYWSDVVRHLRHREAYDEMLIEGNLIEAEAALGEGLR